jgi:hypothetical protein
MASNPIDEINFDGKEVSFKRPGNGRTLTLIFADGELRGDLFRPAAREAQDSGLGSSHIGFRTVLNPE